MAAMAETDLLGEPYVRETIDLPDDDEGTVVATLVHRAADRPAGRVVLHLHGFSDYFFQTGYAEYFATRGYDFYALDLRKCGRSLLAHQTHNFCRSLDEYYPDLDAALELIRSRHESSRLILSGHSTGGLLAPLWLADRPQTAVAGLVLNSPWLDLQGSFMLRTAGAAAALNQLGQRRPYAVLPRGVNALYAESLHRDLRGEWDYDVLWKPADSIPVRAGWLRAIRAGHRRVHRGLDLAAATLVLTSARSSAPQVWSDNVATTDVVLDVRQMARWAPAISRHLTLVKITDAIHDVFLSAKDVRDTAFEELTRWLDAYVG
jgi:alpha-beta hydrolase superfamily lysophospholipase